MNNLIKFFFHGIIRKFKKMVYRCFWTNSTEYENHPESIIFNQDLGNNQIVVLIFNDGRNTYLRKTLNSLQKNLVFPIKPYIIILDDQPINRDLRELEKICQDFQIDRLELNKQNLGLGGNIKKGWSLISPKTQYVWHQENDFIFKEKIDINLLIKAFEKSPEPLLQICLLREPWSYNEFAKGGIFNTNPDKYIDCQFFDSSNNQSYSLVLHREIFSFNPCLYSSSLLSQEMPLTSVEASFSQKLFSAFPNHKCAYWGTKSDLPRITHIGDIKSYNMQY